MHIQNYILSFTGQNNNFIYSASEIRQEHPLNLSISISGGKEINQDCPSSGERTGKSSIQICGPVGLPNCNLKGLTRADSEVQVAWNSTPERVIAPYSTSDEANVGFQRVGLFGIAALNGRQTSSKAKYLWETDSEQVL
eukprot:TRINITY_DN38_c1_g1_i1.p1 TRINITY_DN38_c1_g1~~TRINITY_DN38_c1_g1_i1.p1  ORF type:complete len:139 (-),score=4.28 TRINITY_DN38_c1_g1_i1:12-428(-)